MLFLPLEQLQNLPTTADLDWPALAAEAHTFLSEDALVLVALTRSGHLWSGPEMSIQVFALNPRDFIAGFLDKLRSAVEFARDGRMAHADLLDVVDAFNPHRVRPEGISERVWLQVLSGHEIMRTLIAKLNLESVIYTMCLAWYITADATQPGSRQWQLAQAAKPAQ